MEEDEYDALNDETFGAETGTPPVVALFSLVTFFLFQSGNRTSGKTAMISWLRSLKPQRSSRTKATILVSITDLT